MGVSSSGLLTGYENDCQDITALKLVIVWATLFVDRNSFVSDKAGISNGLARVGVNTRFSKSGLFKKLNNALKAFIALHGDAMQCSIHRSDVQEQPRLTDCHPC